MRKELSMNRVHTVNELFALVDHCARAEKGRLDPEMAKKGRGMTRVIWQEEALAQDRATAGACHGAGSLCRGRKEG